MRTSSQPTSTSTTGANGLAGLGAASQQRLPVAPRERKPALAALAVLLILGGALVSAYLVIASGDRVSAIVVTQRISAGEKIPASALKEMPVGDTGILFLRWDQRTRVTETYASVSIAPNTLLTNEMLSQTQDLSKGRVIVGLSLKPAQLPAEGLTVGQKVALYAVGGRSEQGFKPGVLLSADAFVYKLPELSTSRRTSGATSNETRLSVAVPPEQAALLAQAASAESVAVVLVPPGSAVAAPKGTAVQPQQTAQPQQPKPGG